MYKHFFKRLLDIIVSVCGLIILSPLLALVTIWLHYANNGAGAFFYQERPGRKAKVFKVIKFKTMTDEKDDAGNLLPDEKRITKSGMLIRSTSIDELLQLINVLKGEMSLVGPRPLLVEYLPHYNAWQTRRHEVRPGITGWAQVNGRNAISLKQKIEYDIWYVDHVSLFLDIRIILLTIVKVFLRENIEESVDSTLSFFKGNN